jgi:hypothetical protein
MVDTGYWFCGDKERGGAGFCLRASNDPTDEYRERGVSPFISVTLDDYAAQISIGNLISSLDRAACCGF